MADKRPIDRQREAAINLTVGSEADGVSNSEFYKIGDERLFTLYGKAIYEMILPDSVDPERTNPNIPPHHQLIMPYGLEDECVGRILMTAKVMFGPGNLVGVDEARASALALDCLKDVIAMRDVRDRLVDAQKVTEDEFNGRKHTRESFRLPSVPDIEARFETFIQKTKHAIACLNGIALLFYGDQIKTRKWMNTVVELLTGLGPLEEEVTKNWEQMVRFVMLTTELRNASEHPKDGYRVNISDYKLGTDNTIAPPLIELVHPELPFAPMPAVLLMSSILKGFMTTYESTVAMMCDANVEGQQRLKRRVLWVPVERRRYRFVGYSYAAELNGELVLIG